MSGLTTTENNNPNALQKSARVCGIFGAYYHIQDCQSGQLYLARLRGRLRLSEQEKQQEVSSRNYLAVGDKVFYVLLASAAKASSPKKKHKKNKSVFKKKSDTSAVASKIMQQEEAVIEKLQPRKNEFVRTDTARRQVLAANIDELVLLLPYHEPRFNSAFADRVMAEAFIGRIPLVLVFNKKDLLPALSSEEQKQIQEKIAVYQKLPLRLFHENLKSGISEALAVFFRQKESKRFLLMGQSGSGKSTLLNCLYLSAGFKKVAATADIGLKGKGRHTTTNPLLYVWQPSKTPPQNQKNENKENQKAKEIIDIPGVREFGLMHRSIEELSQGFPEIEAVAEHCRFENCRHLQEPDCAVKEAVARGEMAAFRYDSYCQMAADLQQNFKPRRGDYRL